MEPTKQPNNGWAHLVHHDVHWELCYNYQQRVDYIKASKPTGEQAQRLKYFQLLPAHYLPEPLREAADAWREADDAWQKADAAWQKAGVARREADAARRKAAVSYREADATLRAAHGAWLKADAAWLKADAAWRQAYTWLSSPDGLRALALAHAELFPDCPWDEAQQTMFPNKGVAT